MGRSSFDRSTLVTGVTGATGTDLVSQLLAADESPVVVLIRASDVAARVRFDDVCARLRDRTTTGDPLERLSMIEGDVTQERFGLRPRDYRALVDSTASILHGAASTRFSLPLTDARHSNVIGTRNVIRFALDCRELERLGVLSTVYVAGRREGLILEEDLVPSEFVNSYEQSKFEAEQEVRAAAGAIPTAVYRLATVIGSSETGWVPKMTAVHRAIELAYRGLVPMVPGDEDARIELVDLEYVSRAVAHLFTQVFTPGATYHLVAGRERTFTLKEFIDANHRIITELDPTWAARGIEIPPIVAGSLFGMLTDMISAVSDPDGAAVLGALRNFVPQLLHPKEFSTGNADSALPAEIVASDIRDYYPRILEYCLRSDWGRGVVGAS